MRRWDCLSWIRLFFKSLRFALHASPLSALALQSSQVEVMLWPMAGWPVCLGIKNSSGVYDQIFITVWQLHACWCGVLSLTRRWVCRLPEPQSAVVSLLSVCTIYISHVIKCMYVCIYRSLMELTPSWEAANCAATQELLSILWNLKVQYQVHKSPPLVHILSQFNPNHTILSFYIQGVGQSRLSTADPALSLVAPATTAV
jgi:hypothetical protein